MKNNLSLGMLLKLLTENLEKELNNKLKNYDLTMSQMGALLFLREKPSKSMSLKELEKELHVAQSTAAGIASRLEAKGFIEAYGQKDDKRIKMIRVTDSGEKYCDIGDRDLFETEAKMLQKLSDEEGEELLRILTKMTYGLL